MSRRAGAGPAPVAEPTGGSALAAAPGPTADVRRGTIYGLVAYVLWGAFPLYFVALEPSPALEVLAHRILWSLLLCVGILGLTGRARWVIDMFRDRRLLVPMALAGLLIALNWTIYIIAVMSGHVTEAALGYFLNPLLTVALGVIFLRERLRTAQWVAVAIGCAAGLYLTVSNGSLPWISLSLALCFAGYGLIKKQIGSSLSALDSLTGETVLMAPFAIGLLVWITLTGQQTFLGEGAGHTALLVSAGVATTVPLLLFAAAAKRVTLVTIGLLQFINPVLQLLVGVLVLGEMVPTSRWVGFSMVWVALAILSVDSLLAGGRSRRLARAAEGAAL